MPRFTFSQRFGATPSEDDYNNIKDDFLSYVNDVKFTKDNVQDESIRFRHLKRPASLVLYKDCGNAIWNGDRTTYFDLGGAGSYDLYRDTAPYSENTLQLSFESSPEAPRGHELVEFTFWYYPYSVYQGIQVAPGVRNKNTGIWYTLNDENRHAGIGVGFYTPWEQPPYDPDISDLRVHHPFLQDAPLSATGLGQYDRPGTVGYGGPIICTASLKKKDIEDIDAFGMMFKNNDTEDYWSTYPSGSIGGLAYRRSRASRLDRLFLLLVARDY